MRRDLLILSLIKAGRLRVDTIAGAVFAPKSNKPEKPVGAVTAKGYRRLCITVGGKQMHFMVHRIVWVAAHGPLEPGQQIDHLNGEKCDNRLDNLEAVSGRENMRRAARNGLTNGGWRDGPRDRKTGQFIGKKRAGRLLDGVEWNGFPG